MSNNVRDMILANVPEDGSAIGNLAMLALLREISPGLTEEEYDAAKDGSSLKVCLARPGRGGSIFLGFEDDEGDADAGDDFALTAQERQSFKPQDCKWQEEVRSQAGWAGAGVELSPYRNTSEQSRGRHGPSGQ